MIKGEAINLRVVRESDLDTLFELRSDLERRGEFFPLDLPSETVFKRRFHEDGFWGADGGRLLIVNKEDDRILGAIWFLNRCPTATHWRSATSCTTKAVGTEAS